MSNGFGPLSEDVLLLVPTAVERQAVAGLLPAGIRIELCGFGPIAAGVQTAWLLADGKERQPIRHLVLLGTAGTWEPDRLPPGSAASFRRVECDGVGAGQGRDFRSAAEMGFSQADPEKDGAFADELPLVPLSQGPVMDCLVTVTSATGNGEELQRRRDRFPHGVCEEMEGFAVALAAARFGVPLTIVRGISNEAGNRDHATWLLREAMESAVRLLASSPAFNSAE